MATTSTTTAYGRLEGLVEGGVVVFRGIPYAQPPLGTLRFAPPQPPTTWSGVRDATAFGPPAMQAPNAISDGQSGVAVPSEDCLSLNVWTPALDQGRRPVLVWLHGGAFLTGAGSKPMYHGAVMARRGDVVVVTLNYRLGLFGYLRATDICQEALTSTGNEGLLDQLAALRWVKDEIASFGGDPGNVTVAGQSAGARSIAAILATRSARGLFHKAILQSGSCQPLRTPAAANQVMESILADVKLAPRDAGRLRELSAGQLLDIQTRVTPRAAGISYGPVADGAELPKNPESVIAAGSSAGIPLLVGTNLDEYKFFRRLDRQAEYLTDEGLVARLADPRTSAQAGDRVQFDPSHAVATYRRARAGRGESTTAPELWFAIMSDRRFRVPLMRLAGLQATHTAQTYAYLFTWQSPAWSGQLGAGHVVEVPFVFGTLDAPDSRDLVPAGAPVGTLSEQMLDAWVAFARAGNPRTAQLPDWEPYTIARRSTMLLGSTSSPRDAPYEAERFFWETQALETPAS